MTGTRRQVGWVAAVVSIISLLAPSILGEPKTYHEILAFPWFYGVFALMSIAGSLIAGRLLSSRWYYITMFWIAGGLMAAFVIWY
jgi:hypothetical protein